MIESIWNLSNCHFLFQGITQTKIDAVSLNNNKIRLVEKWFNKRLPQISQTNTNCVQFAEWKSE